MSTLLQWRTSTLADVWQRQRFTCAVPPETIWDGRRKTHPAQHEIQVQSWLRSHRVRHDETLLLGIDGDGIAAMTAWTQVAGPSRVLLQAVAVASRHRHHGGEHAREAITTALDRITADAARTQASTIGVEARIHPDNHSSKVLCAAHGFRYVEDLDHHLKRWALSRPLRPPLGVGSNPAPPPSLPS